MGKPAYCQSDVSLNKDGIMVGASPNMMLTTKPSSLCYTMPVQCVTQQAIFPMKFYEERLLNNQSHLCEVNHV